jgi:hypothetical protein
MMSGTGCPLLDDEVAMESPLSDESSTSHESHQSFSADVQMVFT